MGFAIGLSWLGVWMVLRLCCWCVCLSRFVRLVELVVGLYSWVFLCWRLVVVAVADVVGLVVADFVVVVVVAAGFVVVVAAAAAAEVVADVVAASFFVHKN